MLGENIEMEKDYVVWSTSWNGRNRNLRVRLLHQQQKADLGMMKISLETRFYLKD